MSSVITCLALLLCHITSVFASVPPPLVRPRDEAFQPSLSRNFPHLSADRRIVEWRDDSIDPCDDFYKYACGGFEHIYRDFQDVDVLDLMQQTNQLLMENILAMPTDALAKGPTDKDLFTKTRDYYDSCRDAKAIQKRGFSPIVPYAEELVRYAQTSKSLPELFSKLHQDAVSILFRTSYGKVPSNDPKDLRLQFLPAPAYDVSVSTVKKVIQAFLSHGIVKLPRGTSLDQVASWVVAMEEEMSKFVESLDHQQKRGHGLQPTQFVSIDDLNQVTRQDWRIYTSALNMTGTESVYFFGDADVWAQAVRSLARYHPKDLRYYLLWRLGASHFNKLSSEYYDIWAKEIRSNVVHSLADDPSDQSDVFQHDCITETGVQMPYLSGHLFVKYAFNGTQKESATVLVNELIAAFGTKLQTLKWMDDSTRSAASDKLAAFVEVVGYPEWLADPATVSDYYGPVRFDKSTYFENAVQAQGFALFAPSIHQIGKPLDRASLYFGYPWQLNAFHLTDLVQIQINPGILQRPLFSSKNPRSMNYGSLGMVIGHEVVHGFDNNGRRLDKDGKRTMWWSESSTRAFNREATCYEHQYNGYKVPFANATQGPTPYVDGRHTLAENVADNGGLDVAYEAWVIAESKATGLDREQAIAGTEPGFGTATKQELFFLAFAQTWCSAKSDKALQRMSGDEHSPNPVRVNGVLHNSIEFAKAYRCTAGSRMNPVGSRCSLY
ncbi:hypothetical protein HKX48_000030 [Thoreauomyces humboldtii]|nr:hypothetical protein HKX48_000030 [Thoreauomyces humboldtii]